MNDEASVHYTATIDQMSEGLVWLKEQFGGPNYNPPTIAWQVDTVDTMGTGHLSVIRIPP